MKVFLAVLLVSLAWGQSAGAEPTQRDRAAAVVLFDEARALMTAKRYRQACPKFARALELAHGVGIQLNLALCYVKLGKLASAWTHFLQVIDETERASSDPMSVSRLELAKENLAALEPRLTRLLVQVEAALPDQSVHRGKQALDATQWGVAIPVDPGDYEVTARAPGHVAWSSRVAARAEGRTITVVVPPLVPEADPTGMYVAAGVLAGVGVVGLGVGTVVGVLALRKRAEADPYCPTEDACYDPGADLVEDATTLAHVATASFVVGGAALAAALTVWLVAPSSDGAEARVKLGPGFASLDLRW